MKNIFLFPGQGAQYRGMALDFWARSDTVKELFALCSSVMAQDVKKLLEGADDETLKRTDVSQPLITVANLAAAAFLAEQGVAADGAAGFSLGEYAALAVSKVVSTEDCFRLVAERGKAMQAAATAIAGGAGMAAVIGLAPEKVRAVIEQGDSGSGAHQERGLGLFAANINSKRQTVVSGTASAIDAAEGLFKQAGARRFVRLPVAGPFHSPLMAGAAEAFAPVLEGVRFNDPAILLYSNVTGKRVTTGKEAKELAVLQITSPVQGVDEEAAIIADDPSTVYETGPGHALAGFWRDTGSEIPCLAAGTAGEIEDWQ